ncbi:MAG: hypothetical protein WBE34_15770 [Candidatus Nitrosopolaris sp.]
MQEFLVIPAEWDYTGKIITRVGLSIQICLERQAKGKHNGEVWNKVYKSDNAFFGQMPATLPCYVLIT